MPRYTINAPGDGGPASSAQIAPTSLGIAVDIQGNIYFAEAYGIHRVRMITRKTWNIRTIVGSTAGVSGVLGDGGLAINALLSTPGALAIDNNMNLFIAEVGSGRIRMVNNNTNIITTIAGNTDSHSSPNGGYSLPATSANLLGMVTETSGLAVDFGHVYVVDYTDNKVFVVNRFTGILMAYAGTGDLPCFVLIYIPSFLRTNLHHSFSLVAFRPSLPLLRLDYACLSVCLFALLSRDRF